MTLNLHYAHSNFTDTSVKKKKKPDKSKSTNSSH